MPTSDVFRGHSFVEITELRLTSLSSHRTVDLSRVYSAIQITASIFEPTISGTIILNDHSGLIYDLPIAGEEVLDITFKSPTQEQFQHSFHVNRPRDIVHDPGGAAVSLTLDFVSFDQIRAIATTPSLATQHNIHEVVRTILTSNISTGLDIHLEPTRGIENLVLPNGWNCWQTIEFLRQRAVSVNYSSPYVFFEDRTSFNFMSIEFLIQRRKQEKSPIDITAIPFLPGAGEGDSKATVLASQYRNVENFQILEKADIASLINTGGMHSQTSVMNLIDKTFETTRTSYQDMQGAVVKQSMDGSYNPQQSSVWASVTANNTNPPLQYVIPVDSTNKTEFAPNVSKRQLFARQFGNIKVSFQMYGDSSLNPGDLLNIAMPRPAGLTQNDSQLDGIYIVASLQHTIRDQEMYTTVEAHKYGFNEKVF